MGKPGFMVILNIRDTFKGFKERCGMIKIPLEIKQVWILFKKLIRQILRPWAKPAVEGLNRSYLKNIKQVVLTGIDMKD